MKGNTKDTQVKARFPEEEEFKGYTMDELKYHRALLAVKKEFLKEKAVKETKKIKDQIPGINGRPVTDLIPARSLAGRIFRGLDLFDYIVLGFQAVKIGKKLTSIFRKK